MGYRHLFLEVSLKIKRFTNKKQTNTFNRNYLAVNREIQNHLLLCLFGTLLIEMCNKAT